jgi:hypothetical protein
MDLRPGFLVNTRNHIPRNLKTAQRFSRSPLAHARKRRLAHIEPVDARLDLRIVLAVLNLHFSRIIFTMISTSKIDEFLLKGGKSLSA